MKSEKITLFQAIILINEKGYGVNEINMYRTVADFKEGHGILLATGAKVYRHGNGAIISGYAADGHDVDDLVTYVKERENQMSKELIVV